MQQNPNLNPNQNPNEYEFHAVVPKPHPAEEKLKKIKVITYACLIMLIIVGSMFAWAYVRLSGCENAYNDGFEACRENVRTVLGGNDPVEYIPEMNVTAGDIGQIGMIT